MKKDIQNLLGNNGGVPGRRRPGGDHRPEDQEADRGLRHPLRRSDGLAFYPDWPVPGFYDVLVSGPRSSSPAARSPTAVLDALQKPYDDERSPKT